LVSPVQARAAFHRHRDTPDSNDQSFPSNADSDVRPTPAPGPNELANDPAAAHKINASTVSGDVSLHTN
jgi:hypothetical protein